MNAGLAATLALTMIILGAGQAAAAPYAAYVMDARTGQTLHASDPDRKLHPASLTKMMTLYLAIQAVKNGDLRLDQKVTASRRAASQPPSKIYLQAGHRYTVRHLMRAAAVKSANDAALALAEAVSGSQEAFARLMTQTAREMGMNNTTFRNPHGLTQRGHLSTARDMAILGRRLFFDHPEYYNLFSRKTTTAMGRTIRNTNRRLLSSYRGADGIKTGYTSAAGYNLVASAQRGGKHVITAVFGGRSSRSRNAEVARLLDLGFQKSPRHAAIIKPRNVTGGAVVASPLPVEKPGGSETLLAQVGNAIVPAAAASAAERPARRIRAMAQAPLRSELPTPRPGLVASGVAMKVEVPTPRPR
ncbi:D-alanyl-D-alanine carboxypeptidase family protein [Rhodovulum sp. DZ06]|uniref:D-alanyl-D-alanine carboxypeptidase family protein n=1 Tax=Rhodovulum sp. DZ06 TaxID=3425126 RepID=UPI003D34D0E0